MTNSCFVVMPIGTQTYNGVTVSENELQTIRLLSSKLSKLPTPRLKSSEQMKNQSRLNEQ